MCTSLTGAALAGGDLNLLQVGAPLSQRCNVMHAWWAERTLVAHGGADLNLAAWAAALRMAMSRRRGFRTSTVEVEPR